MRLEYIVIGFILVMVVLLVAITMLKDIGPSFIDLMKLIREK